MRLLEEMWYGNIEPAEYDTKACSEYCYEVDSNEYSNDKGKSQRTTVLIIEGR